MKRLLYLLAFVAPLAIAQSASRSAPRPSATDLYHSAARAYVDGENEQAVRDAERSLALNPDDPKTKKLLDLLRQQQPPQNGDGEQENDEPQDGDEGEPQDQQSGGQNPDAPEEDDEARRDQTQQEGGEPEEQERNEQQGQQDPNPPSGERTPADTGQPRPAQMSRAEAQRLLDAVAADEELLVEKMRRPTRQRRSERDW